MQNISLMMKLILMKDDLKLIDDKSKKIIKEFIKMKLKTISKFN